MRSPNSGVVILTAQELYDLVWSRPVSEVAKEYGLSDVGLAKLCRRHGIPLPERGYWQKKRSGRRVKQVALPERLADLEIRIEMHDEEQTDSAYAQALERLAEGLSTPPAVPETLEDVDPLVRRTQKSLNGAKADEKGLRFPRARQVLNVHVAPASIDRAMRILDGLLKTLPQAGMQLQRPEGERIKTVVEVEEESLEIAIAERVRRMERPLTSEEREEQKRGKLYYIPYKYQYHPTGHLCLKIVDAPYGCRESWCDGKQKRIENHLGAFLEGLVKAAVAKRLRREERKRREREWEIEEQKRMKLHKRLEEEKGRVKALESSEDAWSRSQRIREYVAAVEVRADPADEALQSWLSWVRNYADWLDPLTESPQSILDEPDPFPGW